jgi:hypothetical protein
MLWRGDGRSGDGAVLIGKAHCETWDENGLAVWTLRIGGQPIEGRWVIVARKLRPAQQTGPVV